MQLAHLQKPFAACGPLSAALFVAADRVGAALTPGYSSRSQAVSELIEVGAPYKYVVDPLLLGFHGLVIPFALGLHLSLNATRNRLTGPALLAGAGMAGLVLTLFFPCDPGCEPFVSVRGTMHIFIAIPMGFAVLFAILAFGHRFGSTPGGQGFRRYSFATFAAGIALAVITVVFAETDLVGWLERALTLTYLQWYAVVGIAAARRG